MAKRAGMTYAVFTTKHHDGYAMYDTQTSDYGVMRSPYGRDIFGGIAVAANLCLTRGRGRRVATQDLERFLRCQRIVM